MGADDTAFCATVAAWLAGVAAALATASAWLLVPSSVVVFGGSTNGVTCNATCVASWPPFTVSPGTHPRAGSGVKKSLIGTVSFTPGYRVVTYDKWPLYTYAGDTAAGVATGQALNINGGLWYVISPSGVVITKTG